MKDDELVAGANRDMVEGKADAIYEFDSCDVVLRKTDELINSKFLFCTTYDPEEGTIKLTIFPRNSENPLSKEQLEEMCIDSIRRQIRELLET